MASCTDRNGAVTSFDYDVDGLLKRETRPNSGITNYTYDPIGRLIEADNPSSHINRTYDDGGRLKTETTCANTGSSSTDCPTPAANSGAQPSVTLTYDYYPDDQLRTVTSSDPNVAQVQYGYDTLGRLASLQYGSQPQFMFGYDALGRFASLTRPNGIVDTFGYTASGDLQTRDAARGGVPVARFDYSIGPITGRRNSLTDNFGTHTFGYFDNGQLQSATHPTGTGIAAESYTYDAAGNRSPAGATWSYDSADRVQSDGTFIYRFDNEGNLIQKTPVAGGSSITYTWNAQHQLVGITYPDGTTSAYRYDAFGRRIGAVDRGQETRFVFDGLSVQGDYNSQNQLQTIYIPSLEQICKWPGELLPVRCLGQRSGTD